MCDFFLESHAGVTGVVGLGSSARTRMQPGQLSVPEHDTAAEVGWNDRLQ